MFTTSAYACDDGSSPMKLATIKRRDPGPRDVEIEIEFCGVCHSDIHTARSEWPGSLYPCVPGHEIIGRVGRVGSDVTRFKTGDRVGVGCIALPAMRKLRRGAGAILRKRHDRHL